MAKYLKPDCEQGFIEDSAEIKYLKFNNMRHTILGCMLGDFDENGFYHIDEEIKKELLEMPKYIVESMENLEICHSELKLDKQLTFLVTLEEDKATLSLLEKLSYEANIKLNSGTYSNVNEYVLDEVQTSGKINRNVLYNRWNISEFPGMILDIFNCDPSVLERYFGIVERFKYVLSANISLLNKEKDIEEIEAEYATEMLAIIKRYPKLEKSVMEEIKKTMAEKKDFITPNKPNFAKTFNELLDKSIEANKKLLSEAELKEFNIEKYNVKNETDIKRTDLLAVTSLENDYIEKASLEEDLQPSKNRVVLDVGDRYLTETVLDIAKKYLSAQKKVYARYAVSSEQTAETNRSILITKLAEVGIDLIPHEVVTEVKEVKSAVAPTKAPAKVGEQNNTRPNSNKTPSTKGTSQKTKSSKTERAKGNDQDNGRRTDDQNREFVVDDKGKNENGKRSLIRRRTNLTETAQTTDKGIKFQAEGNVVTDYTTDISAENNNLTPNDREQVATEKQQDVITV